LQQENKIGRSADGKTSCIVGSQLGPDTASLYHTHPSLLKASSRPLLIPVLWRLSLEFRTRTSSPPFPPKERRAYWTTRTHGDTAHIRRMRARLFPREPSQTRCVPDGIYAMAAT
jgi:hypothetical protein